MDPVGQVLDEIEDGRLGPLQVVEDDDGRPARREMLQQPSDRPEELLDGRRLGRDAERLGQLGEDRLGVLDPAQSIAQPVHDEAGLGLLVERRPPSAAVPRPGTT